MCQGGLTERENVSAESANLTGRCFTLHVSRTYNVNYRIAGREKLIARERMKEGK